MTLLRSVRTAIATTAAVAGLIAPPAVGATLEAPPVAAANVNVNVNANANATPPAEETFAPPAPKTRVSLALAEGRPAAGGEVLLALRLVSEPGWHTYWKEPGETGMPPSIKWTRLENIAAGGDADWRWPPPVPFTQDFDGVKMKANLLPADATIRIPARLAANAAAGAKVVLAGTVSWLECDDKSCHPQEAPVSLSFTVEPATGGTIIDWQPWSPEAQRALLDAGRIVFVDFTARWCATCQVNKRVYSDAAVAAALARRNVALLRADWTRPDPRIAAELARHRRAAVPFNVFLRAGRPPVALPEILTAGNVLAGLETIAGETTGNAADTTTSSSDATVAGAPPVPSSLSLAALVLAFLGGVVLNLMPCVFPVLALKALSLARQAGGDSRRVAAHGLVFTGGVLAGFWTLGAALLALRAGGARLGWGFQLQEPLFVLALAALLLVLALNMAGVFEVGGRAAAAGEKLRDGSGARAAFFTGLLAVAVATPCSAPFLGASLGAALTLPAAGALALLTAVALGLAAPHLVLALAPALASRLPRPGAWMESLKQGLSFLLFASAGWLVWVLAGQVEPPVLLDIIFGLTGVALACWVFGRWTPPARPRRVRVAGALAALAIFGAAAAWMLRAVLAS
ncbi:MAG: thioredoxin family protein [Puniceicoccales bacterium]|jgi:thiol:disulfide interchange protein DsbD|nr:thioredoxin family protein [Puniceicoccales bacterium]